VYLLEKDEDESTFSLRLFFPLHFNYKNLNLFYFPDSSSLLSLIPFFSKIS